MKGIIYIRVSSNEQVKGTSLETQQEACLKYCTEKGIQVLETFREEGESAKTDDRTQFLNAIEFCRKHQGEIEAFVVWKVDRFARNVEDHFSVKKTLSNYKVTLHSVTEAIGSQPAEKFMEALLAASAQFDNEIRRQRCMGGMAAKLKQGIWPWKPPMGYVCAGFKRQGLKKAECDQPDIQTFPIIQKALKEYSKGLYSQADIARILAKEGCGGKKAFSLQLIDKLLGKQLPFYAGLLPNPWTNTTGGEKYIQGLHTPMITEDEMYRIIQVRSGKKVLTKWDRLNPLFPLRRTVLCADCLNPLTGSASRGNGGVYEYYHCYHKGCGMNGKGITKDILEKDFVKHLKKITPTDAFLKIFKETALNHWKEQGSKFEWRAVQHKAQLDALEKQRIRIFEMGEEGSYTKEEFKDRKEEINNKIIAAKISYSEARIEQFDIEAAVDYAIDQISNLPRLWKELAPDSKVRFQKLVFPEGIPYSRKKVFRTLNKVKLGCIYEMARKSLTKPSLGVDLGYQFWNQFANECNYLMVIMREYQADKKDMTLK